MDRVGAARRKVRAMSEPTRAQDRRAELIAEAFASVQAFPLPDGRIVLYGLRETPTGALKATYREVIDLDANREERTP